MISAFGVEHGGVVIAKKQEPYVRRGKGDSVYPRHRQTTFTDPDGAVHNVDRKMKRTVVAMNRAGLRTSYSDQGDLRLRNETKDAYVSFVDPGHRHADKLSGQLPKRFRIERHARNRWNPRSSTVRFRGGPVIGEINRARLRREVQR